MDIVGLQIEKSFFDSKFIGTMGCMYSIYELSVVSIVNLYEICFF